MKKKTKTVAWLAIAALGITVQANAALITQTVGNIDWTLAMWGPGPSAPVAGNDYISAITGVSDADKRFRISADGLSSTFGGDNLTVVAGTRALMKNLDGTTATISGNFTLDGGRLSLGPVTATNDANATLACAQFIVSGTGSFIEMAGSAESLTITGPLNGSGDLLINYETSGVASNRSVILSGGIGTYTGDITVDEGMGLAFGVDSELTGTLNLINTGKLIVDQEITVHILYDDSGAVNVGTYSNTALDALGAQYENNGGTLIVETRPSDGIPPSVPTNLTASGVSGVADLNWDANPETGITYNVYRGVTTGNHPTSVASGLTTNSYIDDTVLQGSAYFYVVTAFDGDESDPSAEAPVSISYISMIPDDQGYFEAEDAITVEPINSGNTNFSGTGYVDYGGEGEILWVFESETAGTEDIYFGYAFNSDPVRPLAVEVNGTVITTNDFASTGGWSTWLKVGPISADLVVGLNQVRLLTTGNSGPNVDYMEIAALKPLVPDFAIESSVSGSTLTLIIMPSVVGLDYYLDSRESLVAGDWLQQSVHTATDTNLVIDIDISGGTTDFYRGRRD